MWEIDMSDTELSELAKLEENLDQTRERVIYQSQMIQELNQKLNMVSSRLRELEIRFAGRR